MDEAGKLFFSEVFFLFSKNVIKSTTAAIVTSIKDDLLYIIKQFKWNVPSKSSNCLSHVAWHNHWIVLNLGSTDSSWNGAFVIIYREGCPFFMELYNSVNVHDVEKSKIMLHGIKTLLEWAIWQEISAMLLLINVK